MLVSGEEDKKKTIGKTRDPPTILQTKGENRRFPQDLSGGRVRTKATISYIQRFLFTPSINTPFVPACVIVLNILFIKEHVAEEIGSKEQIRVEWLNSVLQSEHFFDFDNGRAS